MSSSAYPVRATFSEDVAGDRRDIRWPKGGFEYRCLRWECEKQGNSASLQTGLKIEGD